MQASSTSEVEVAIGGGRGFIGAHVERALRASDTGSLSFGREGFGGRAQTLIWCAGGRGDAAELEAAHVDQPFRHIESARPGCVIYLSSASVYGQAPVPFVESGEPVPTDGYGQAKWRGEQAVRAAALRIGARVFILRPAVVYGPGQRPGMLLPSALASLSKGEPFDTTEGSQTRDFLEVSDLVRLVLRCREPDAPPGVYNAGRGEEVSVRAALEALAHAVGPEARELLRFGARPMRPGEPMRYVLATEKAQIGLGWHAQVSLEAGMRRLVAATGDAVPAS